MIEIHKGHREQLNMLTSYLDASQIYGVNDFKSKDLRHLQNGII